MTTLLIKNASYLLTMDPERRTLQGAGLFVRDNYIESVGHTNDLPQTADRVLDATGMIVLPGLVNVHHHFSQNLTRVIPSAQDKGLFPWLYDLYPLWAKLGPEEMYISAKVALAELILSGCTTTSDNPYMFPNGSSIDEEIRAAQEMGVRFHPARGCLSYAMSKGGLVPDEYVEDEDTILTDSERVINTYHDPSRYSMCRVAVGPVDPESGSPRIMKEIAIMARQLGVMLHIHVDETMDDVRYSLDHYGKRPVNDLSERDWVGEDVWYVHCVHADSEEIEILARTGTRVAHCPSANMRLGSGIAPIKPMLDCGVVVGIGVDGSASNDTSHMLAEVRMALLGQRAIYGPDALSVQKALELATIGGAAVLNRDDIGSLEPGKAADFIGIRADRIEYSGAVSDPVAALILCAPVNVDLSVINGRVVLEDGHIVGLDIQQLVTQHNHQARKLLA